MCRDYLEKNVDNRDRCERLVAIIVSAWTPRKENDESSMYFKMFAVSLDAIQNPHDRPGSSTAGEFLYPTQVGSFPAHLNRSMPPVPKEGEGFNSRKGGSLHPNLIRFAEPTAKYSSMIVIKKFIFRIMGFTHGFKKTRTKQNDTYEKYRIPKKSRVAELKVKGPSPTLISDAMRVKLKAAFTKTPTLIQRKRNQPPTTAAVVYRRDTTSSYLITKTQSGWKDKARILGRSGGAVQDEADGARDDELNMRVIRVIEES
ncbi:uncharacterized protein MELLADRAFT_103439 [Melampsora larici-populina 98AG31]|uniref:Uncharacterized protein n=1 Tax=Melampsora larici-populina (strain 98AG31 / pathotype 3-4-7) TaxID=747676 RepID=F4RBG7_MELLP|nr:uncharacterized protein MELLADRAFT_103439 [Melampsora larici-populina 98AG31]EGG10082.1 hypothetical protein MELLADRAFT_103439 [Melampsora larici-populina 98AG31]